jgi:8-hydroxy-5-deazaflavin:NADPH oxidoreductase
MKIGILGAGRIGANAAALFAKAGHTVAISNSKGPESLKAQIQEHGTNVSAVTSEEAVNFGEIVLIAVPWLKRDQLPKAELFENKIVIDAMNAYGPRGIIDLSPSTSSEEVSKQLPGARLVKGFNTMYFETLRTSGKPSEEGRLVIFIAGDDSEAKAIVAHLIEEIGFAAVDTGFLHEGGRLQQPDSAIYNQPMTVEEARTKLADL